MPDDTWASMASGDSTLEVDRRKESVHIVLHRIVRKNVGVRALAWFQSARVLAAWSVQISLINADKCWFQSNMCGGATPRK